MLLSRRDAEPSFRDCERPNVVASWKRQTGQKYHLEGADEKTGVL